MQHQYIDRETGAILDERLYADRIVNFLYSRARENLPLVLRALTSGRMSSLLGYLNYDMVLGGRLTGNRRFLELLGIDLQECVDPPAALNTPRKIFERKIRYWESRPMPEDPAIAVSPADAKVLTGSLNDDSLFFIKEKFFSYNELLGERTLWRRAFRHGDFAIFRLTPEKYHYNHVPVSGRVIDHYEVDGAYHSCNPGAVVALATPYSKNKRVVTIIDTDCAGGSGLGKVAMIEVVALMIGQVAQRYSPQGYDAPRPMELGMRLEKGAPKSLFRPGSSTDVLLFQEGRIRFDEDLERNMHRQGVRSRFSLGFGHGLVETDVKVRSSIARAVGS